MKKTLIFASRSFKEIIRDPVNIFFGFAFPVMLLLLLSAIQSNIPEGAPTIFKIEYLTPGIAVFGLTFFSLFSANLIAKDKSSSLMMRLFASPLTPSGFIIGYALPILPIALIQEIICFALALILGLKFSFYIFLTIAVLIPAAILDIGIGLLCGSVFTDKQAGVVCGALLTNLSAWLSGTWFDLSLIGKFEKIAYMLPFAHAVDAARAALAGDISGIFPHLWWVIGYAVAFFTLAVVVFRRKMKSDKI